MDPVVADDGFLLVGSLRPSGSSRWMIVPGSLPPGPRSAEHRFELRTFDGRTELAGAHVEREPDGEVVHVSVPIGDRPDALSRIVWHRAAGSEDIVPARHGRR